MEEQSLQQEEGATARAEGIDPQGHPDARSDARPDLRPLQMWKLLLAYDGTDFHGWQVQPGKRTVQGELCRTLFTVTGEHVLPQGSGRTDTGVHAEGQAVSVGLRAAIPADRLLLALNRRLPGAIRVLEAVPMPGFHARSGVMSKTYEYRIVAGRGLVELRRPEVIVPPWQSRYVWECRVPLSLEAMQAAAGLVVGTHDFSSFAACDPDRSTRLAREGKAVSNVRTIFASCWQATDGLLRYRVTGSGFLHHMVRNLVGTLIEVGSGRRPAAWVTEVLAARDRRAAGPTAPPQGLFLMHVVYASDRPVAAETDGIASAPLVAR